MTKSGTTLSVGLIAMILTFYIAYPLANAEGDACKVHLKYHLPIFIDGNDDFERCKAVRSGDGTPQNPYIISNLNILATGRAGIHIKNTNASFVIKNCNIRGVSTERFSPNGIHLDNVKNGKILGCRCIKCGFGILLVASSNNTIESCRCERCSHGISINGCPYGYKANSNNNVIVNCTVHSCDDGIYFCCLPGSSGNLIYKCNISKNHRGIVLDHCIHYTIITNCNISHNDIGVDIISASSYNYITNNIFWENKKHARDNCKNYWDNGKEFGGNYWRGHDYSRPYYIPGRGKNVDSYPLHSPNLEEPFISYFSVKPRLALAVVDQEVYFDGSLSFVPEGTQYFWNFGDGTNGTGCKTRHAYKSAGYYNVTLRARNGLLEDSFSRVVRVVALCECCINVPAEKIQDAINSSEPGCIIIVDEGIYHGTIIIDTPYIRLIGDSGNTVIDGRGKGNVVTISAPFVTIEGFTITNSSSEGAGIQIGIPDHIVDAVSCYVKNNYVTGNHIGINLSETEQNTISNNLIADNSIGIGFTRSYSNIMYSNSVSSCGIGLSLVYGSNWNEICNNTFTANGVGIKMEWSHYNLIKGNEITSNEIGLSLSYAISTKINYNDVCNNKKCGLFFEGCLPISDHNWWGSRFGPSWLFPVFGDSIKMRGFIVLKPLIIRLLSYPWLRSPTNSIT